MTFTWMVHTFKRRWF